MTAPAETDMERARKLLPCTCFRPLYPGEEHHPFCPVRYRSAVAAALAAARAEEREACARWHDKQAAHFSAERIRTAENDLAYSCAAQGLAYQHLQCAAAIRARGKP